MRLWTLLPLPYPYSTSTIMCRSIKPATQVCVHVMYMHNQEINKVIEISAISLFLPLHRMQGALYEEMIYK